MSSQEFDVSSEQEMQVVRAKILGASIRVARLGSGKSLADCAKFIDQTEEVLEKFELGEESPSLPQLELIAYFLETPLDRFWVKPPEAERSERHNFYHAPRIVLIRDRIIGAMIRQSRVEGKMSIEDLCLRTSLQPTDIEAIELGKKSVSVPQLELIARAFDKSIQDFQDKEGLAGKRDLQLQAEKEFKQLPLDLQVFLSAPENLPYLELARRLSEMSADKLRSIAEGILEITY